MGVPLMRIKTLAYLIGAFFGGAAGCLITLQAGATSPQAFSLQVSIFVLCMVILGGMGNVWGVALGGALLAYINYQGLYAAGNQFNSTFGTNIQIPEYAYLIYGLADRQLHAAAAGGPDPERAPEGGAARGRPGDAGRARGDRAGMTAVAPNRLVGDRSPDRRPAPAEGVRRPGRGRGRRLHRRRAARSRA